MTHTHAPNFILRHADFLYPKFCVTRLVGAVVHQQITQTLLLKNRNHLYSNRLCQDRVYTVDVEGLVQQDRGALERLRKEMELVADRLVGQLRRSKPGQALRELNATSNV